MPRDRSRPPTLPLQALTLKLRHKTFPEKEAIISYGELAVNMYIVKSGIVATELRLLRCQAHFGAARSALHTPAVSAQPHLDSVASLGRSNPTLVLCVRLSLFAPLRTCSRRGHGNTTPTP